ncbi:NAD(P)H-dependent oxidoreductase [Alkalicoccus halolimnae]|uniref:NAD(P)H-dependent oxidoreductase n=1 Tax=Alkalicoccus halolimnae TaxID=1667239 RepID=A0AAJ8LXU3_9BACI|nr:NAD(P)H-dependent oxidoreductase [Alkalicoccus halolimnae]
MIIYMHPSQDSFNGSVYEAFTKGLKGTVTTHSPGIENFNPNLTIEEYNASVQGTYASDLAEAHEDLKQADHIVFMFPLWWGSFPAAGKGFIDRVFSYGVAYELEGEEPVPLLKGKKASLVFTTGAPPDVFHKQGLYKNVVNGIDDHLLAFCGLKLYGVLHFGDVQQISDEKREVMLDDAERFATALSEEDDS